MPVGSVKKTGRYGEPKMNSNVIGNPYGIGPDGGMTKDGKPYTPPKVKAPKKASLPAPPPVGSGGGPGVVSPMPKKLGTAGAQMAATPGPISGSPAAPPSIKSNPVYAQLASTPGPGETTPATNIPGAHATAGVTDRMSGFASRYDPSLTQAVYDRPETVLEDLLRDRGASLGNTRRAEMGDYADTMMNLAVMLGLQGSAEGSSQLDEATINTMAELMANGMGPGGRQVDYREALNILMNPEGGLNAWLFGAPGEEVTMDEQLQYLAPMFKASIAGVNPWMQRAMMGALEGAHGRAAAALPKTQPGGADPRILNYLRSSLGQILPDF